MTIDAIYQMQEKMTVSPSKQSSNATAKSDFANIFNRQLSQRNQSSQTSNEAIKSSQQRPQGQSQPTKADNEAAETKQPAQNNSAVEERPQKDLKSNETTDKSEMTTANEAQETEKEAVPYELLAEEILALLTQLNMTTELTDEEKTLIVDTVLQLQEELSATQSLENALVNLLKQLETQEEIKLTPEEKALFMEKLSDLLKEEKQPKAPLAKTEAVETKTDSIHLTEATAKPQQPILTAAAPVEEVDETPQTATVASVETAPKEPVVVTGKEAKAKEQQEPVEAEAEDTIQQLEGFGINTEKADIITKFVNSMQQDIQKSEPQNLLNQIVNKVELLVHSNKNEIKMKLSPEALGSLSIEITVEKGVMTAKVFTENYQVKELIENNLNQLKINLGEKGINVSSLEVNVGQQQESFQFQQSQMQQQRQKLKRLSAVGAVAAANYVEDAAQAINPYVINSNFEGLA